MCMCVCVCGFSFVGFYSGKNRAIINVLTYPLFYTNMPTA